MRPAVTVLLPVRNGAATIAECVRSVLAQTLDDFELIVVDDHSGDETHVALGSFTDSRIRILPNPGRGLVSALNTGLLAARANLVARMDADDRMAPIRLERQHHYLTRHNTTALLGSRVEKFPAVTDGYQEYLDWQNNCLTAADIDAEIFVESPFAHPSVMFRRDVVRAAGGYRHGDFPEDYELWLRLHRLGRRMEKLPEFLLQWRDTPRRLSRTSPRFRRAAFDELRAVYLATDPRFRAHAGNFAIWGAGRRTRQRCSRLLEKGFRPRAWIDIDPRKIGNRLDGVPVVAPEWLERNRVFVLSYVSNHGAREDIAGTLHALGYRRGEDYLAVG
ncbi:MAG: glycosyltransferase [Gammaproteobacteria bacterium]|nr:glycosyltransferase [Gammaproteobacteria bacterium]